MKKEAKGSDRTQLTRKTTVKPPSELSSPPSKKRRTVQTQSDEEEGEPVPKELATAAGKKKKNVDLSLITQATQTEENTSDTEKSSASRSRKFYGPETVNCCTAAESSAESSCTLKKVPVLPKKFLYSQKSSCDA